MGLFSVLLQLTPLAVGDVVDRAAWPAHITLVGNFRAPDPAAVEAVVARFAAATPPVQAVVGEEAWFEPNGSIRVDTLVAPRLIELHGALLDDLEAAVDDLEPVLPDHTRDGYRPHRTVTAEPRPSPGDVLESSRVSLVELDPPGRPGVGIILGAWPLDGARQQD